jgi:hypothetical protein
MSALGVGLLVSPTASASLEDCVIGAERAKINGAGKEVYVGTIRCTKRTWSSPLKVMAMDGKGDTLLAQKSCRWAVLKEGRTYRCVLKRRARCNGKKQSRYAHAVRKVTTADGYVWQGAWSRDSKLRYKC